MQRVTDDSRRTEAKLWFSYRENEAKEKALKKQLNKTQMALALSEAELSKLKAHNGKSVKKVDDTNVVNMDAYLKMKLELEGISTLTRILIFKE